MLLQIDTFLLKAVQWIVRQFELFTPWSRYIFGRSLLALFGYSLVMWTLFLMYHSVSDPGYFILAPTPFVGSVIYLGLKRIFEEQYVQNFFPESFLNKEILKRKKMRFAATVSMLIVFSFFFLYPQIENNLAVKGNLIFLLWTFFLSVLLEYFLCTSLFSAHKHSEKEKHEADHVSQ